MAFNVIDRINGKDEWLTPPDLLKSLGDFDLDPCAPINRPWDSAKVHFTSIDNGLEREWFGRVWMNPPYGNQVGLWLRKISDHGNGIALVFARTDTKAFQEYVFKRATSLFFVSGRISFYHSNGKVANYNAGAPSCLVAYGWQNAMAIQKLSLKGTHVFLKNSFN